MFNVGDVVEITEESASTGMLDFVEGKGYTVEAVDYNGKEWCAHNIILLKDESGKKDWYNVSHFKLKDEKKVETDFRVGQAVWCVIFGKGVVESIDKSNPYPVEVQFDCGEHRCYTLSGDMFRHVKNNRTLFFSEPKIIAETKPQFVPTLKEGTPILLTRTKLEAQIVPAWVNVETRDFVDVATTDSDSRIYSKNEWKIFSVGEKIEFN